MTSRGCLFLVAVGAVFATTSSASRPWPMAAFTWTPGKVDVYGLLPDSQAAVRQTPARK